MSGEPVDFNARITKARKEHKCFACGDKIVKGQVYIGYPGKSNVGVFQTTHLCIICSYLIAYGRNARSFLRDPKKAIESAGLTEIKATSVQKRYRQIVVKTSEFDRRIFHLPESRWKVEQFPKGGSVTIKAGVTGASRIATIKGAWSTDGSCFGCSKRQVAILVA